jgi:DNA-binding SARP family transcriptional activator
MEAEELLVEAEIDAGRAQEVLERARALVAQAPSRERRWALVARALHQSGRQPEALGAINRARTRLVEEFGLDPGRELVELETLLLRHDASLTPAPSVVSPSCPYRVCSRTTRATPRPSSVARTTSPPAYGGCVTPACWP